MSDFTAVRAVSKTLLEVLRAAITNDSDPQLNGVPIDLRSPKEMREAKVTGVSLWLYRVTRDPDLLNRPPARVGPNQRLEQPLPVHLFYLVTPIAARPEDEQALLGRVLQTLNDHAILRGAELQDALAGSPEELRLALETLSHEELTRIWTALEEPYQLSVTYVVQVVEIDSDREAVQVPPVLVREVAYTQTV